jgi:hypothetical protein
MLEATKEYCLRAKVGEQWKTMVSAKLNDKGNPSIGISPELITLLQSGKWANLSLSVYDKREQPKQETYQQAPQDDFEDGIPF